MQSRDLVEAHRLVFSAKLYDHQGPIARGGRTIPPDRPRYEKCPDRARVKIKPLKLKILSSKNRFGKFWDFDPWRPQFWPEPKNDRNDFEMIFRELSNAAFRFSLRRPGTEIMGGAFKRPPPSRRWKIQRPSRAQVNPRPAGKGGGETPSCTFPSIAQKRKGIIELRNFRNHFLHQFYTCWQKDNFAPW